MNSKVRLKVSTGMSNGLGPPPPGLFTRIVTVPNLRTAIANTLLAFRASMTLAVLWQRVIGKVAVAPLVATVVLALVAAIVSGSA